MVPSRLLATHTPSAPTVIALGPFPTGIDRTIAPLPGLIRDTVLSLALVTQTAPRPTATPLGVPPTGIVSTTSPLSGSILETELSRLLATHTAPAPRAIPVGPLPTGTVLTTVLVVGLIHDTDRSPLLATHTAPPPATTPAGSRPTGTRCTTRRAAGSTLATVPCSALATHSAPSPTATGPDRTPNGTCPTNRSEVVSISPRLLASIAATVGPRSSVGRRPGPWWRARPRPARPPPAATPTGADGPAAPGALGARAGRRGGTGGQPLGRVLALRDHPDDPHRLGQPLEMHQPTIHIDEVFHPPGQMGHLLAHQHLPRPRQPTQPRRQIQGPTPIAPLDRHRLPGVQPDPHPQRQRRVGQRLLDKAGLELDRRPQRLAGRGEHRQRLIPAQLDDRPPPALHPLPGQRGELGGQLGGRLVAAFMGEQGVAPHIGDQERPDLGPVATATSRGVPG